jgi:hypothetical protein
MMAPGVPPNRVAALRKAFMGTMRDPELLAGVRQWRTLVGAIPGPMEAWLVHRGLATLDDGLMKERRQLLARFRTEGFEPEWWERSVRGALAARCRDETDQMLQTVERELRPHSRSIAVVRIRLRKVRRTRVRVGAEQRSLPCRRQA